MKPVRDLIDWYLRKKHLAVVPTTGTATLAAALERLRNRHLNLGTIIDVGASDGRWSAQVLPFHPNARYLCVEAQPAHQDELRAFAAAHPQVEYVLCAAGDREGQVHFEASDPFGGMVLETPAGTHCLTVPMSTIDKLVAARGLPPPFLLKLDTHGYELPILEGAAHTLQKTEALVVEVYNFPGGPPAVPFYEFCRLMAARGFRCVDLFDPLYRTHDDALWQMDLMFLRATRPEFQYLGYA